MTTDGRIIIKLDQINAILKLNRRCFEEVKGRLVWPGVCLYEFSHIMSPVARGFKRLILGSYTKCALQKIFMCVIYFHFSKIRKEKKEKTSLNGEYLMASILCNVAV